MAKLIIKRKGGEGSGFRGHAGRPGLVGGSSSEKSADILIDELRSDLLRGIIPLDKRRIEEWIDAGLYTREFADYFVANPNGEIDKYVWETRKVDELRNLYIWHNKRVGNK